MVASPKITLTIPTLTDVAPLQATTMSHAATVAEQIDILVAEESTAQISTIPPLDVVVINPKVDIPEVVTIVLAKVTPSLNPKIIPTSNILEEGENNSELILLVRHLRSVE
ncbi:hypothetical protein C1H46_028102 [Malus baccata]|uniref:Uncharacterized protein n=1 Tax=Malus baccata TaxID=106549 RepID=A0A540LIR4_MALBA|nr:hypothetical protein C1H46_028102 [Malus baccata]